MTTAVTPLGLEPHRPPPSPASPSISTPSWLRSRRGWSCTVLGLPAKCGASARLSPERSLPGKRSCRGPNVRSGGVPALAVAAWPAGGHPVCIHLAANLLQIVPSGHPQKTFPAPTGDLNLTAALALVVVVVVHASAIRARGLRGYLRHYLDPIPWLLPMRILEELARPITLALRLFGNVFAGTVMVILIFELIPVAFAPAPLIAWKLFSVFVAVIQAFLFALLTVLYFQTAMPADLDSSPHRAIPESQQLTTSGGNPGDR